MNITLDQLPIELDGGDLITRYIEWGDMAVRYVRLPAGTDMGPVLEGLPGDRCPSHHWGIVLEGSIHIEHGDGTVEVANAGTAYHWPAGHTGWTEEPVVFLEVGPCAAMRQFGEHAKAKLG
jgi:hypothetical protein